VGQENAYDFTGKKQGEAIPDAAYDIKVDPGSMSGGD
jgi:hypothetical protein